jgi:LL-diaminopimelate aminotransferase
VQLSEPTFTFAAKRLLELPANRFRELTHLKAALAKECTDFIDLSEGIPDLPPHPRLLKFFSNNGCKADVHSYTGLQGISGLRAALFDYLRSEFSVQREDIDLMPGAGSKELIAHLCQAVLNEGDVALIPEIHYPLYPVAVKFAGAQAVAYGLRRDANWAPDLQGLSEEVLARTKIVFLNYPHNPTGGVVPQNELDEIIAFFQERSILVCLDLAYSHIYYEGRVAPNALRNAKSSSGIIELHTFSKSLGVPGWRVAFAAGDKSIIELLDRSKAVFSTGLFVLLQKSLRYGLVNFPEFTAGIREIYEERVNHAVNALTDAGIDIVKPGGTFFLWMKLPAPGMATEFVRCLMRDKKVLLMPGAAFGEKEDQHVRISLTAPSDTLNDAIQRICSQMGELKLTSTGTAELASGAG